MDRLSITFPENLRHELDRQAKKENTRRSTLIQKAVRIYLELKRQKETQNLLRDGYEEMAEESRSMLRDFEKLDRETLKYAD